MALKVGIQLFSVRNAMARDPLDTIAKIADTALQIHRGVKPQRQ